MASTPYAVTLYGADEDYTGGVASKWRPTVKELTDNATGLTSVSIDAYGLFPTIENEGENDTFLDNVVGTLTVQRDGYDLRILSKAMPQVPADGAGVEEFDDYFTWRPVLRKPYLWLFCSNYPLHYNVNINTVPDPDENNSLTQAVSNFGINPSRIGSYYGFSIQLKHKNASNTAT